MFKSSKVIYFIKQTPSLGAGKLGKLIHMLMKVTSSFTSLKDIPKD